MSSPIDLPMYCSVESYKSKLDPSWIKLADRLDFYLVFELREPWDKWIDQSDFFPIGLKDYFLKIKKDGKKFKYFCVKPKENEREDMKIRVLFYVGDSSGYTSFKKMELIVPENQFLIIVQALVENKHAIFAKFEVPDNDTRDIFVCTHFRRDQCCGIFGTEIMQKMLTSNFNSNLNSETCIRFWQSSHMGGHRVGPTFMEMPSGRVWGYLKEDIVREIIHQNEDHTNVLKSYRGTMGMDRYSQIVDKAIFKLRGWNWFYVRKRSEIISQNEGITKVKIFYNSKLESGEYSASVISNEKIILPATECSKSTTMTKFVVMDLKQTIY